MEKEIRNNEYDVRAADDRSVTGTAIVFNSVTDIGWFKEQVSPEAVDDDVLAQDVRALFNHDSNLILARTKSGTLSLEKTNNGLMYRFDAPPTSAGNDLLVSLQRGDISGSSFGFSVKKDSWENLPDGTQLRTILKIGKLYDVSPVTYPAYTDTTAAKRSLEEFTAQQQPEPEPEPVPEPAEKITPLDIRIKQLQLLQIESREA